MDEPFFTDVRLVVHNGKLVQRSYLNSSLWTEQLLLRRLLELDRLSLMEKPGYRSSVNPGDIVQTLPVDPKLRSIAIIPFGKAACLFSICRTWALGSGTEMLL